MDFSAFALLLPLLLLLRSSVASADVDANLPPETAAALDAKVDPLLAKAKADPLLLAEALHQTFPKFIKDTETALRYSTAALTAQEATGVPATMLLAIPAIESNFDPRTISRRECRTETDLDGQTIRKCARVGGRWRGARTKPSHVQGTYYCGLHQTGGRISWARCWRIIAEEEGSFLTAAVHLQKWYVDGVCRKIRREDARWTCALYGYGGGYPLIEASRKRSATRCFAYPTFNKGKRRLTPKPGALCYPYRVRNLEATIQRRWTKLQTTTS